MRRLSLLLLMLAAAAGAEAQIRLPSLPGLALPTLVIAGDRDPATPVAMSQAIVHAVPGARLVVLDGAAHLSVLEQPAAFTAAVQDFLATLA
mgnify:CR=1 FL=1